jgi:hypothetical protein
MPDVSFLTYMKNAVLSTLMPNVDQAQQQNSRFVNYFLGWPEGDASVGAKTISYLRKARFLLIPLNLARRPIELVFSLALALTNYARDKLRATDNLIAYGISYLPSILSKILSVPGTLLFSVTSPSAFQLAGEKMIQAHPEWGPNTSNGVRIWCRFILPAITFGLSCLYPPLLFALIGIHFTDILQNAFEKASPDYVDPLGYSTASKTLIIYRDGSNHQHGYGNTHSHSTAIAPTPPGQFASPLAPPPPAVKVTAEDPPEFQPT